MNLFDTTPIRLQVVERANPSGRMVVRGEFGRCDVPTANRRVYGRTVIESNLTALREDIKRRRVLGELDHPDDGRTMLKRASHVITKLEVDENGLVIGEAEILNTPHGQALRAIIEADCEVGVSSRGTGSTATNKQGMDEVQSDFVLRTYDFVFDPAMKTAYPQVVRESIEQADRTVMAEGYVPPAEVILAEAGQTVDVEAIKAAAVEEAKATFAASLPDIVAAARREGEDAAKRALAEDRGDIDAKLTLEAIAVAIRPLLAPSAASAAGAVAQEDLVAARDLIRSQDLDIADLTMRLRESTVENLSIRVDGAIRAAVRGQPRADALRRAIGPSNSFASIEEANERIAFVIAEFGDTPRDFEAEAKQAILRAEAAEADAAALRRDLSEATSKAAVDGVRMSALTSDVERLRVENTKLLSDAAALTERLKSAVEIGLEAVERGNLFEAKYQEASKLVGRNDAPAVLALLEESATPAATRAISQANPEKPLTEAGIDAIRNRVRKGMENLGPISEETASSHGAEIVVHPTMKLNENEFKRLAGLSG